MLTSISSLGTHLMSNCPNFLCINNELQIKWTLYINKSLPVSLLCRPCRRSSRHLKNKKKKTFFKSVPKIKKRQIINLILVKKSCRWISFILSNKSPFLFPLGFFHRFEMIKSLTEAHHNNLCLLNVYIAQTNLQSYCNELNKCRYIIYSKLNKKL